MVLIATDSANDLGLMLYVLWDGWDRVGGDLYCAEHASELLAALPSRRPMGGASGTYARG